MLYSSCLPRIRTINMSIHKRAFTDISKLSCNICNSVSAADNRCDDSWKHVILYYIYQCVVYLMRPPHFHNPADLLSNTTGHNSSPITDLESLFFGSFVTSCSNCGWMTVIGVIYIEIIYWQIICLYQHYHHIHGARYECIITIS